MAGMPGGRHFAVLSLSNEPETRDFLIACHFARYSGVSWGAVGARPCDPSESGAVRVNVQQRFALAEVAEAHRALEARRTTGSTVLLP